MGLPRWVTSLPAVLTPGVTLGSRKLPDGLLCRQGNDGGPGAGQVKRTLLPQGGRYSQQPVPASEVSQINREKDAG